MQMLKVAVLTEGGIGSGLGHITRCLGLYEALEEFNCSPILIVNGDDSLKNILKGKKHFLNQWTENYKDNKRLNDAQILIIDSYLANEEMYHYVSDNFPCPVFLDDNIRLKYPKGIVVNGAVYAETMNYPKNPDINYLLGSRYTPLRKTFWNVPGKIISDKITTCLIAMGGNDTRNLIPGIIALLREKFPAMHLKVIIGNSFDHISDIKKYANNSVELIYNADAKKMKEVMMTADIAISAAGQTLYELACIGLPTIAIQIADNQKGNVNGCLKAEFIEFAGKWDDKELFENILKNIQKLSDKKQRQLKSEIGQKWMDGQGSKRIAKKVLECYFEKNMHLRKAFSEDVEIIYELSNDDEVRKNSFNQDKIEFSQHQKWFNQKINSENCLTLIAESNKEMIGQIRFDVEKDVVVSISVHKNYRNLGIGNLMMKKALQFLKNSYPEVEKVVAFVKENNIASKKYFEKCNFKFIKTLLIKKFTSSQYNYYFEKTQ